jgi:surface polysaccharide O-acyltransferase-like enzyme
MKKNYNFSADVIRVLAICGVVIIHTVDSVYGRPDFFGGLSWWFAIFLNSISRASIPLFILISGFFILNKQESYKQTLLRAWNRLGIPLLFWFIVMTIWRGGNPTLQNINLGMIKSLLTVNVFILFFLIILLGLYCVAPILRVFLQTSSNTTKRIFVISTISFGSIFYFFQYLYSLCTPATSLTYWLPYVGLFVAGYYIGNKHTLQKSKLILGIFCATLLIQIR